MANFFRVNRDFHSSREARFCKIIFRETRNKCLNRREPWFYYVFVIFDNRYYVINDVAWPCRTVDPCCDNVVGLVFGDLWPAIIFILRFVYFDHNGGSASTRCPRSPRSSTRTTSLHGFTKCECVNKIFLTEGNKKILIHKEKYRFPFSATAHTDFEIFKKAVLGSSNGTVQIIAGSGEEDNNDGTRASFSQPMGICMENGKNILITSLRSKRFLARFV